VGLGEGGVVRDEGLGVGQGEEKGGGAERIYYPTRPSLSTLPEALTVAPYGFVNCRIIFLIGAYCLIRQRLRGRSGPQRLIRALAEETGNPIMAFYRPSFPPSFERAPAHHNTTENALRWSLALTLSLALPNPLSCLVGELGE